MKRHAIIIAMLFAGFSMATPGTCISAPFSDGVNQQNRDLALEKSAFGRKQRLGARLQPSARIKLDVAAKKLVSSLASNPERVDPLNFVRHEVVNGFASLSVEQENLLVFYVLAESATIISGRENLKGGSEKMGELSEMASLRLEMAMDRRSKFMSTLSNIMKKVSATQDALVRNIK